MLPLQKIVTDPIEDQLEQKELFNFTIFRCYYKTSPIYSSGWWINIWRSTFLRNTTTREELQLSAAIEIPYAPERFYLHKFGQIKIFSLLFPPIPKNWTEFDLVEESEAESGFFIQKIKRNKTGVYRVVLS